MPSFGSLEVDPQLDLGRLFHGQIGRIGSVQNRFDVIARPDRVRASRRPLQRAARSVAIAETDPCRRPKACRNFCDDVGCAVREAFPQQLLLAQFGGSGESPRRARSVQICEAERGSATCRSTACTTSRSRRTISKPTRDFYRNILGLEVGFRPDLNFPGYWLYCGDVPVVHLVPRQYGRRAVQRHRPVRLIISPSWPATFRQSRQSWSRRGLSSARTTFQARRSTSWPLSITTM